SSRGQTDAWLQPSRDGWHTVLSLRSWALVGSSVMAIWSVRHPNMLIRWARRGFGAWSAWRLVKTTLRQQQLR
ncbi:YqjK-like family protein, partial [Enterobacter hormaechei]